MANQLIRILSLNIALRPAEIEGVSGSKGTPPALPAAPTTAAPTAQSETKQAFLTADCICQPDYHVYNSHEVRVRGFLRWLFSVPAALRPDIICFQELMWLPMVELIWSELEKLGYTTTAEIDPLSPANRGQTIPISETVKYSTIGSGLAIFYLDSRFDVVTSKSVAFAERLGADRICEKGFMWLILADKRQLPMLRTPFCVLTLHPQAYVKLEKDSPPCESAMLKSLRRMAASQIDQLGGYPKAIEMVHVKQFQQIAAAVNESILPLTSNVIFTGDFNVNSFEPEAGSIEETDPTRAAKGPLQGREFRQTLAILDAVPVPTALSSSTTTSKTSVFTWDPARNWFAASEKGSSVFQKIDHTLLRKGSQGVSFIDQQIVPLPLIPFPELDLYWTPMCAKVRKGFADYINEAMAERVRLGQAQRKKARFAFESQTAAGQQTDENWERYVLGLDFAESSQLWKGLVFYGFQIEAKHGRDERSIDYGVRQFLNVILAKQLLLGLKVGDVHPFRMFNNVSDHFGLMTRLSLAVSPPPLPPPLLG